MGQASSPVDEHTEGDAGEVADSDVIPSSDGEVERDVEIGCDAAEDSAQEQELIMLARGVPLRGLGSGRSRTRSRGRSVSAAR